MTWEFFMIALIVYLPFFNFVFDTVPLPPTKFAEIALLSLSGLAFLELVKLLKPFKGRAGA